MVNKYKAGDILQLRRTEPHDMNLAIVLAVRKKDREYRVAWMTYGNPENTYSFKAVHEEFFQVDKTEPNFIFRTNKLKKRRKP